MPWEGNWHQASGSTDQPAINTYGAFATPTTPVEEPERFYPDPDARDHHLGPPDP